MFSRKDNTYNEIREKSYLQWLDEMEAHADPSVRCGVRLARDYMQYLKDENNRMKEEKELAQFYLKKMIADKRKS